MPFFLQGFLSVISPAESLVLTSHCPILFPFYVWVLPCRLISCPKTVKNEQTLLYASEMCYSNTVFAVWFRRKFPDGKEEIYCSAPENLKDRSFFLINEHIKIASIIYSHWFVTQALLHPKHPCTVRSLKTLPIATVTISQLYFTIRLSMLWST